MKYLVNRGADLSYELPDRDVIAHYAVLTGLQQLLLTR